MLSTGESDRQEEVRTFYYRMGIAPLTGGDFQELEALVDSGSTYTWIPRPILERLGISPEDRFPFILADGRQVEYPVAWTRVRLDGKASFTLCIFGDENTTPLLGAFTLEAFRLSVDPVNRRLVPVPGLLKAVRGSR